MPRSNRRKSVFVIRHLRLGAYLSDQLLVATRRTDFSPPHGESPKTANLLPCVGCKIRLPGVYARGQDPVEIGKRCVPSRYLISRLTVYLEPEITERFSTHLFSRPPVNGFKPAFVNKNLPTLRTVFQQQRSFSGDGLRSSPRWPEIKGALEKSLNLKLARTEKSLKKRICHWRNCCTHSLQNWDIQVFRSRRYRHPEKALQTLPVFLWIGDCIFEIPHVKLLRGEILQPSPQRTAIV